MLGRMATAMARLGTADRPARRRLEEMDDRALRDIGVTRDALPLAVRASADYLPGGMLGRWAA